MKASNPYIIFETLFKVKKDKENDFQQHCRDTTKYVENHKGFVNATFSKRIGIDDDYSHYRVEIVFDDQDSLNAYQKDVVPKIRENSKDFGDDAKVEDRRVYEMFYNFSNKSIS